jgi:hypothetical protein
MVVSLFWSAVRSWDWVECFLNLGMCPFGIAKSLRFTKAFNMQRSNSNPPNAMVAQISS